MRKSLTVLSFLLLLTPCALAAVVTLHGTGFDAFGNPLAPGGIDASWIMAYNPVDETTDAYFIVPGTPDWWGTYPANTNAAVFQGSGWISTNFNNSFNGSAPYSFSMTFSLAGFDLNTVSIAGLWSIADGGTLDINGHVVDTLQAGNEPWSSMHAYSINNSSYFLPGLNTITMTVTESDTYFEAVRFEGTLTGEQTGGVPEPGTLLLVGSGLLASLGAVRRKLNL